MITALLREGQRLRKLEANLTTEVHAVQPAPRRGASSGKDSLRWYKVGERPCRSIDSVILEGDNAQHILADCREFMTSEKWFAERGIPYRRGYLLEGKPGTGTVAWVRLCQLRSPITRFRRASTVSRQDVAYHRSRRRPKASSVRNPVSLGRGNDFNLRVRCMGRCVVNGTCCRQLHAVAVVSGNHG